ncbi:hypothetical protein NA56DRAFT_598730, partial [Hyaloscypha hepaticicola]
MSADDRYEQQNDAVTGDIPAGDAQDNDYVSRTGQKDGPVPIQSDSAGIDDPIDEATADSDEQLVRDDNEAIDQSNIIDGRTRGVKPAGGYREPGDEEGLPGPDDGTSS